MRTQAKLEVPFSKMFDVQHFIATLAPQLSVVEALPPWLQVSRPSLLHSRTVDMHCFQTERQTIRHITRCRMSEMRLNEIHREPI
jgi:hypothetical protein